MPVTEIAAGQVRRGPSVDLVIVRDLLLEPHNIPRTSHTSLAWLHRLFPYARYGCRILAYDYPEQTFQSDGEYSCSLRDFAITLIKDLAAARQDSSASTRPLIFLCHGVGGLLAKFALSQCYNQLSEFTGNNRAIYESVYGIIFVGTPHNGISRDALEMLRTRNVPHLDQLLTDLLTGSILVTEIESRFSPLLHHFRMFNVWEQLDTVLENRRCRIVDKSSAAPSSYVGDQGGMLASHADMLTFQSTDDQGYGMIANILDQYITAAQQTIGANPQHRRSVSRESTSSRSSSHQGHVLEQGFISGGTVHLGDVYYNYGTNVGPLDVSHDRGRSPSITLEQDVVSEYYEVPRSSIALFVGREELASSIKNHLHALNSNSVNLRPKIAVIHGIGGSGKTQFCLRYAENNRSSYWGVFWVDASTRENAEASFAQLGSLASRGATFSAGRYWLSQSHQPWLLILDNADDPGLEISDFIPPGTHGHVLITTRNPDMAVHATAGFFRLQEMDEEEAVTLLLQTAYLPEEPNVTDSSNRSWASRIAKELGYLAKALYHAGRTIRRNIYTIDKYLQHYLGYRHKLVSSANSLSADETSVVTTWEIPFQRIEKQDVTDHQDAVVLVHIFAFMHFSSISEEIFRVLWTTSSENFCCSKRLPSLLQADPTQIDEAHPRLRRAIGILREHSIIEHDVNRETCALHPVIHRWARTRPQSQEKQSDWLEWTIEVLARCISPSLDASGRQFRSGLLPHIDALGKLLNFKGLPELTTAVRADQLERFAWVYAENGIWKTASELQNRILKFRKKKLGKTHEGTLRAMQSLADIHWNLFEVESAIKWHEQIRRARWWSRPSLADWKYLIWPDHISYCVALDNLTQSLWLAGRRDWSKYVGERAVAGLSKRLGPDNALTLNAMFNLSRTYIHTGNLKEAHEILPTVLRKRRRLLGSDHPETLMTRNELGVCFFTSERSLAIAERLITGALQARKRVLGEEHAYTLWSVNDLSKVLCKRNRPSAAVKMLRDIVPIVDRTLGREHIGMMMVKDNLVRAYISGERWTDAENIILELLPLVDKIPTASIDAMTAHAFVKFRTGRLQEAEDDYKKILDKIAKDNVLGPEDSKTLRAKKRLGEVQTELGKSR